MKSLDKDIVEITNVLNSKLKKILMNMENFM